jgi:Transposase IS66 family
LRSLNKKWDAPWGIDISTGQVNRLLNEEHQIFEQEQHQVLKAGLETATYIHTDDTGARHNGKNGYCTVIGNEDFAYFHSSDSKSRENFLEILQAGSEKYVLNEDAKVDLENYQIPQKHLSEISYSDEPLATTKEKWHEHLLSIGITGIKTVRILTEAALLGGLSREGRHEPLRILSDGAGQFNVMQHGLCWVHKIELLQVLECPEFPLHNNAAETDIREYVTRRKISGGTRSELGRRARDTFVGLKKTCRKLGISFWNYLTSRLHGSEQLLSLSDVIRAKAAAKILAPI